ncbi:MAG: SpoIIE family protein phosphatase [Chloroflexota bacterium]
MISIDIAVAKTHKYASRDSGDTAEVGERPTGGISVVMVDGQGSGHAAKSLSMLISSKAISLLKEGIRDGAVARGTHDYLHAYRHGKVSATLDVVSVDLATSEVVVVRNNPIAYIVGHDGCFSYRDETAGPIGPHRHSRPIVDHYPIEAGLTVVVYTDGIAGAGMRTNLPFDPLLYLRDHARESTTAEEIANGVLMAAIDADQGRPRDDMTVVALNLVDKPDERENVRRMHLSLPIST